MGLPPSPGARWPGSTYAPPDNIPMDAIAGKIDGSHQFLCHLDYVCRILFALVSLTYIDPLVRNEESLSLVQQALCQSFRPT